MFHQGCEPQKELELFLQRDKVQGDFFEIGFDPKKGRFLKANKDIQQGELILEEDLLVRGPVKKTKPVCLTCYSLIDWSDCVYCPKSNFPFCNERCNASDEFQTICKLLPKVDGYNFNYSDYEPMYDTILPLKILALKDSPNWKPFWKLMSQSEKLLQKSTTWKEGQKHVIDFLLDLKLPDDVDENMIYTILAIIETNSVDKEFFGKKVKMLHPLASLLNHDCSPNVVLSYSGIAQGHNLQVRATKDIQKGQELTVSYIDQLLPTSVKQKLLKENKFFDCHCTKCLDNKEDKFLEELTQEQAKKVIDKAYEESETIIQTPEYWTVELCEKYLRKYGCILPSNHPMMVRIKVKLAGLYGKCPGYTMMDMHYNRNISERKKQVCQEALEGLEQLEPGSLRTTRGLLLYELHLPVFMGAQLDSEAGLIDVVTAKAQFKEAFKYLHEAIELLKHEQNGSLEGAMHVGAIEYLKIMQAQGFDFSVQ